MNNFHLTHEQAEEITRVYFIALDESRLSPSQKALARHLFEMINEVYPDISTPVF